VCDGRACTNANTGYTYVPTGEDVGRTVRAMITAANPLGAFTATTTQTDPIRAAAPDAPADVSPAAIDFGDVAVGSSAPDRVVTYTNTASGPVTLRRIARGGGQLVDIGLPAAGRTCEAGLTLASGEACALPVRFSPQATGERRATVTIDDGSEHVVRLTGTGQPGPLLDVDTTPIAFGSLLVGKYSAARTLRLTNDGDVGLLIAGVTSVSEFPTSTTCSDTTPLGPGESCRVSLKFHPRYAGARASTVTIRSNAAGGARYVDVSGTGT
jgi:hypothetical protein